MDVVFFFDVVSPYSYLASTQLDRIAAETGGRFVWTPFFLGGVMAATGNEPPANLPARARYMAKDLARWAKHYDVPYRFPTRFPANTLLAQRALVAVPAEAREAAAKGLFRAYWGEDQDIHDPAVVAAHTGREAVDRAGAPDVKAELKRLSDDAVARGAFGAPTFLVPKPDGTESLYFGNDRLPFVARAMRQPT